MDPRTYKPADRIAYGGLAAYVLIQLGWFAGAAAAGTLWKSGTLLGMFVAAPGCAIALSVVFQLSGRKRRFSGLANVLLFLTLTVGTAVSFLFLATRAPRA